MDTNFLKFSDNKLRKKLECYILNQDLTHEQLVERVTSTIMQFLFKGRNVSEALFRQFIDYIDFYYICNLNYISKDFIRENLKYINQYNWFTIITRNESVNQAYILQFKDKIGWDNISKARVRFGQEFIERWKNSLDWHWISNNQHMTEQFIEQHINEDLDWKYIAQNFNLSQEFKQKHKDRLI